MDEGKFLTALKESVLKLDYEGVTRAAREAMEAGIDPLRAITEGMAPAMAIIGEKFKNGECFLPELVVSGDVMTEGLKIINPFIKGEGSRRRQRVVLATVEGDLHDIGKGIVSTLLKARGFEVVDLGVDVPAQEVVEAVKRHDPVIVGLSALLTVTMPRMGEVIEGLRVAELRDRVKVIIGGTSVTEGFAKSIGADHSSTNAAEGVDRCTEWVTSPAGR
jgi:5-methyltetrahydrofolate--homocysteine methyltransferase